MDPPESKTEEADPNFSPVPCFRSMQGTFRNIRKTVVLMDCWTPEIFFLLPFVNHASSLVLLTPALSVLFTGQFLTIPMRFREETGGEKHTGCVNVISGPCDRKRGRQDRGCRMRRQNRRDHVCPSRGGPFGPISSACGGNRSDDAVNSHLFPPWKPGLFHPGGSA